MTRGWLKASLRATDPKRSKPWKPWHHLTRASRKPVVPGEIIEYDIEVMATANLFRKGHRICLEISAWIFRPASLARPMRSTSRTTSAAARRCCTKSTTMPIGHRICCYRSFPGKSVSGSWDFRAAFAPQATFGAGLHRGNAD